MPKKEAKSHKVTLIRHDPMHEINPHGLREIKLEKENATTSISVHPHSLESMRFDTLRIENGEFKKDGQALEEAMKSTESAFMDELNHMGEIKKFDFTIIGPNNPIFRAHTYEDIVAIRDSMVDHFEKRLNIEDSPEPKPVATDMEGFQASFDSGKMAKKILLRRFREQLDKMVETRLNELS